MFTSNKFYKPDSIFKKFFKLDWILLFVVLIICIIGVGALYSAGDGSLKPWALNHIYKVIFGFLIVFIISQFKINFIMNFSVILYIFCILCLIYVKYFGVGDVKRWIDLKYFFFQPSELAKIAIILLLAKFFTDFPNNSKNILYNLIAISLVLIPGFLIINQPDLGTGSMLILLGFAIIFLNGLSWNFILSITLVSLISIPVIWQNLLEYQKYRILVFLNPELDTLGKGYQIMQSKIAIGSGGMFGKGYLTGSQSRLDFLPEKHTDFVYTLISEEMGFIGSMSLLILYFVIIIILMKEFLKEEDFTNKIIIFGISFLIFLYVIFNVGMVSGLIPVVGAPLPFISNGGTSLITIFIGLGIIQSIRVSRNV